MIVVTLTDCPPKLRGDLSKWLCEINTGVYVGSVSSRVRDALWERICENLKNGRATMVFSTNTEQGMDFRVHNTTWQPVDLDGIKLMRRPKPQAQTNGLGEGFSKAAQFAKVRRIESARARSAAAAMQDYTVIDIETSGLHPETDEIIELGALRIRDGAIAAEYAALVKNSRPIPEDVVQLTGLTEAGLQADGLSPAQALQEFAEFIGDDTLTGHNLSFDLSFLRAACRRYGVKMSVARCVDTLNLARKRLKGISNYKLETIAEYFQLDTAGIHRVSADCRLTHFVYQMLMEK